MDICFPTKGNNCTGYPQSTEMIQGTGILTSSKDCEIKSEKILVQAYKVYWTEIFQQLIPHGTIDLNFNDFMTYLTRIKTISTPSVN